MKNLIIASLIIGSAAALSTTTKGGIPSFVHAPSPSIEALETFTFSAFEAHYQKVYASAEDRAAREAIFANNMAMIKAHNSNPDKTFTMTMNHMGDLSAAEFKGLMAGKVPTRNYFQSIDASLGIADRSAEPPVVVAALPAAVDWRNKSVVTPVKNQGSCGSCWAFASTETMESHWAIATGQLYELSTQQVTECTPNPDNCGGSGGCQGATENLAFGYIIGAGGIVTNAEYPYTASDTGCKVPASAKRVAFFKSIKKVKSNDQEDMMNILANDGPVTIGVWADPMQFYGGGVFTGCSYQQNMDIDHAVQLVGYGTEKGTDYWIVRNSWGAYWGESGYIRLKRDATPQCGMDTTPQDGSACKNDPDTPIKVCGQCGLLYESSYAVPKTN